MNDCAAPDLPLREKLQSMIDGYRISQIVCLAAELRIADLLRDGPKRADELAAETRADPHALFRVLRALASVGILERRDAQRFALAPLGEWLRSDRDESLRPWARLSARMYRAWVDFPGVVEAGGGGAGGGYGKDRWERLERSHKEARVFHEAMGANSAWISCAVLDAYDFSAFRSIVDVGGGNGTLIASILGSNSGARGTVFDLPEAIRDVGPLLEAAGLAARCQIRAGSFFDSVPQGGDAYILSRVLHDWDDEHAAQILKSARHAMATGTTLLLIERLLDPESPSVEATLSDLNMLLMNGGCERTRAEFEALLAAEGFRLVRVVSTGTPAQIVEALAV